MQMCVVCIVAGWRWVEIWGNRKLQGRKSNGAWTVNKEGMGEEVVKRDALVGVTTQESVQKIDDCGAEGRCEGRGQAGLSFLDYLYELKCIDSRERAIACKSVHGNKVKRLQLGK